MWWQFFIKNKLVQHFKSHWLYLLFASIFAWVMSNFLTTPTITAIAIVLLVYIVLVILLEVRIKLKICRWFKSEKQCYYIIYFSLLIICILLAFLFWNKLVYICDHDNPYKKPLLTGGVHIEVIAEPNGAITKGIERFGDAAITLVKEIEVNEEVKETNIILEIWGFAASEQIENGQVKFWTMPELPTNNKSINKPIYCLAEAKYAIIWFEKLPSESKIIQGKVMFTFNNSVYIKIPIPTQTMKEGVIVVRDVKKFFKLKL